MNKSKLLSKKDFQKIENKLFKDLYDSNGIVKNNKGYGDGWDLSYTSVKSGIKLYDFYKNQKKYYKASKIKNDIILRIFIDLKNNQFFEYIDPSILNKLIKFLK